MTDRLRGIWKRESQETGLPLGLLLLCAVILHGGVALLALNPWHPDEHFQILEFAWARGGMGPIEGLPWEFAAQIRPSLQPTLALLLLKSLWVLGFESPGLWILLLRLSTLALSLVVLLAVIFRVSPLLSTEGRRVLWLSGLFLWFTPLFTSRFTSENLSGLALASALVLATGRRDQGRDLMVGGLLGLAFLFRFQVAIAGVALLAWIGLTKEGGGWARTARAMITGSLAVGFGFLLDRWFYGNWVFTPWRYFQVNLLEGVAATFGTSPWYTYLVQLPLWMAPPLGLVLMVLVLTGIFARPWSPWAWCSLAFFAVHSVLSHKELRFLLPLLLLLPPLLAVGWQLLSSRWVGGRGRKLFIWTLMAQNVLLALLLLTPAIHRGKDFDVHYFQFLAERAERDPQKPLWVLSEDGRPYRVWDLEARVYQNPRVLGVVHPSGDSLPGSVPPGTDADRLLIMTREASPPAVAGAEVRGPVYMAEPGYRIMARALGLEGSRALEWLEVVDRWSTSEWVRRVYEVVPGEGKGPG